MVQFSMDLLHTFNPFNIFICHVLCLISVAGYIVQSLGYTLFHNQLPITLPDRVGPSQYPMSILVAIRITKH